MLVAGGMPPVYLRDCGIETTAAAAVVASVSRSSFYVLL
jgi:hypothetical protein